MLSKFEQAVKSVTAIEMDRCTCEEASHLSRETFIACGAVAKFLVWHSRDRRAYSMCEPCAYHNVYNRRGILVGMASKDS